MIKLKIFICSLMVLSHAIANNQQLSKANLKKPAETNHAHVALGKSLNSAAGSNRSSIGLLALKL